MLLWWRLKIKILALAVSLCWLVAGGSSRVAAAAVFSVLRGSVSLYLEPQ